MEDTYMYIMIVGEGIHVILDSSGGCTYRPGGAGGRLRVPSCDPQT